MKRVVGWAASLNIFMFTGIISLLFAEKTSDEAFLQPFGGICIVLGIISFIFLIINMYKKDKH